MDEQFRQRMEELAKEMIRRGDYNHLINPGRGARIDRDNQDDRSLRYSIRDIPHLMEKEILCPPPPHTHDRVW